MEGLTLRCGRFVPRTDADADARRHAMEAYLADLSEEMERVLDALGQTMVDQFAAIKVLQGAAGGEEAGT